MVIKRFFRCNDMIKKNKKRLIYIIPNVGSIKGNEEVVLKNTTEAISGTPMKVKFWAEIVHHLCMKNATKN